MRYTYIAYLVDRHGGQKRCIQGFGWENLREKNCLEDLGVNGRIILKRIFKKWYWKERPSMVQDRDRWQAVVNVVMNLRVPKSVRNGLCST